jgi:polar amino acid transport system permease protein
MTLYASAFLADIWRGGVESIPRGQWDAAAALGLHAIARLRLVILPQALRITIPSTVGFLVQMVKATALTSIIGFNELMKTANAINNAVFAPFTVYGIVAVAYFLLCFPLTSYARRLERARDA